MEWIGYNILNITKLFRKDCVDKQSLFCNQLLMLLFFKIGNGKNSTTTAAAETTLKGRLNLT
jgi:hypothetical protein